MSDTATTIAGVLTILTVVGAFWRWALPFLRRIGHFLDDWFGEPERPGFPGQPGVMERLAKVEHEVHTNNGTSMRDAVNRIEAALRASADEQKAMWDAIKAVAEAKPPDVA